MEFLKFFSIWIGSATAVTAALVLIAGPLASLIRHLIYPPLRWQNVATPQPLRSPQVTQNK